MARFSLNSFGVTLALCGGLIGLFAAGCGETAPAPLSLSGETMGTTYSIAVADPPADLDRTQLQTDIDTALETVNDKMSTWREDSELSRFNDNPTTDWVPVSPELAQVAAAAREVSELTGGAFDVTVGPLIDLWGFDRAGRPEHFPTDDEIAAARARCGYEKLEVRTGPPALRKTQPDVYVNLSAIAKGYGVDVVADLLSERGLENFMVEIGGEVRTAGTGAGERDWRIAVEPPTAGLVREVYRVVAPGERGMATSGDYRNFFEQDGQIYSHTIDPATGKPIASGLASATVLAENCMRADALATAMMVLGAERGRELAEQENLPVLLLAHAPGGAFAETSNAAFDQLVQNRAAADVEESGTTLFVAALIVFALALIGMSVGVILSNRRIKGSCGGLNNFTDDSGKSICEACTTPPEECDLVRKAAAEQPNSEKS